MTSLTLDSDVDVNPYFPPPPIKLTPRRQKAHVDSLSKPRVKMAPETAQEHVEVDPKSIALSPIYGRIECTRRRSIQIQHSTLCKMTAEEQEQMAQRLYYNSLQQKGQRHAQMRDKYKLPAPVARYIGQDGVDDLVLRLYRPPSAPSILSEVLHKNADDTQVNKVTGKSTVLLGNNEGETSEEDALRRMQNEGEVRQSEGLAGKVQRRKNRTTTVLTTSGTTVLACIKKNRQNRNEEIPPNVKNYDAANDPHLLLYWKERKRHKQRRRHRTAEERRHHERSEVERGKRHSQSIPKTPVNFLHLREMLIKEELHQRLILKIQESDSRKDLRRAHLDGRRLLAAGPAQEALPGPHPPKRNSEDGAGHGSDISGDERHSENSGASSDDSNGSRKRSSVGRRAGSSHGATKSSSESEASEVSREESTDAHSESSAKYSASASG